MSDYKCHHEDVSWISERGAGWHIRSGSDGSVVGKLVDGDRFEVRPISNSWTGYGTPCSEKNEAIESRLFIELKTGEVESFDKDTQKSGTKNVTRLDSRLEFKGTTVGSYAPQEEWDVNRRNPKTPTTHYYSVWLTEFPKANWEDRPSAKSYIKSEKVKRFQSGTTFPFIEWSNEDVEFAREYRSALRWPDLNIPLAPTGSGNDAWQMSMPRSPIRWVPDTSVEDKSKMRSTWVVYKGTRIEVPLESHYRLFYDEKRDVVMQFGVHHVDLW